MREENKNFMTSLESLIRNYREGIFQPTSPSLMYYDAFGDISDTSYKVLPYGDELVDAKAKAVYKSYIEFLYNYIQLYIVLVVKDAIPVLDKFKKRNSDTKNLPIGDANSKPILETRIYEI